MSTTVTSIFVLCLVALLRKTSAQQFGYTPALPITISSPPATISEREFLERLELVQRQLQQLQLHQQLTNQDISQLIQNTLPQRQQYQVKLQNGQRVQYQGDQGKIVNNNNNNVPVRQQNEYYDLYPNQGGPIITQQERQRQNYNSNSQRQQYDQMRPVKQDQERQQQEMPMRTTQRQPMFATTVAAAMRNNNLTQTTILTTTRRPRNGNQFRTQLRSQFAVPLERNNLPAPQGASCSEVISRLFRRQILRINNCTRELKFRGVEKLRRANVILPRIPESMATTWCILKCAMIDEGILTRNGELEVELLEDFVRREIPDFMVLRVVEQIEKCRIVSEDVIDPTETSCKSYEPLSRCITDGIFNICGSQFNAIISG